MHLLLYEILKKSDNRAIQWKQILQIKFSGDVKQKIILWTVPL